MGCQRINADFDGGHSPPERRCQKICFDEDPAYTSTAGSAQVWWIDAWESGVTEPGSSGSPLFDQNQRIIGQLYGGAAACSGSVNNGAYDYYGRMDVSWGVGLSGYLDPLGTGQLTLDSYPTNSNPDAGCTDSPVCNYDPEATEDNGTCLENDVVESVAVTEPAVPAARTPRPAIMMKRPPRMMDRASSRKTTCLAIAMQKGQLMWFSVRKNPRNPTRLVLRELPESLDISLEWTNLDGGGSWPADLAISITGPDGSCVAIGGYNASPAGCTNLGNYGLWPADWQVTTSGNYTATVDLTGNGLSGNGNWSVSLFNGYGTSADVQYNASWSIAGLCGDGGGGMRDVRTAPHATMAPAAVTDDGSCLQLDQCGMWR